MKCEMKLWIPVMALMLSGCASTPSSYFRPHPGQNGLQLKVAIIPFSNLSSERDADKKISNAFITYLLQSHCFEIVEMGDTVEAIKKTKVVAEDGLSFEEIKKIGEATGADALLLGAVEEYKIDSSTVLGERVFVPEVALVVRLLSTNDGSTIWSANHHRRGDDRVSVFGMGRIDSISELSDVIVRDMTHSLILNVKSMKSALIMYKVSLPTEENSSAVDGESKTAEGQNTDNEKTKLLEEIAALKNEVKQSKESFQQEIQALKAKIDKAPLAKADESDKPEAATPESAAVSPEGDEHHPLMLVSESQPASAASTQSKTEAAEQIAASVTEDPVKKIKEQFKEEYNKIKTQYSPNSNSFENTP